MSCVGWRLGVCGCDTVFTRWRVQVRELADTVARAGLSQHDDILGQHLGRQLSQAPRQVGWLTELRRRRRLVVVLDGMDQAREGCICMYMLAYLGAFSLPHLYASMTLYAHADLTPSSLHVALCLASTLHSPPST